MEVSVRASLGRAIEIEGLLGYKGVFFASTLYELQGDYYTHFVIDKVVTRKDEGGDIDEITIWAKRVIGFHDTTFTFQFKLVGGEVYFSAHSKSSSEIDPHIKFGSRKEGESRITCLKLSDTNVNYFLQ